MIFEGKTRKFSCAYRTFDDINNLRIRIKLKEIETSHVQSSPPEKEEDGWERKTIAWQQKIYSTFERILYRDEHNCPTNLEKKCHLEVVNMPDDTGAIFTYTNSDNPSLDENRLVTSSSGCTLLLKNMRMNKCWDEYYEPDEPCKLVAQLQNDPAWTNDFEVMHIVADLGEYVGDSWCKFEHLLCTIKWNAAKQILSVYPDFSECDPYVIQIENGSTRTFNYYIENVSEASKENWQEVIDKIHEYHRSLRALKKPPFDFVNLPKDKMVFHLFVDIETGCNFEYNNVFVKYYVCLPEGWQCRDKKSLNGSTHSCAGVNQRKLLYFGHAFQVMLECDMHSFGQDLIKMPHIYLETISKDAWGRCRSEGLGYLALPVCTPGRHQYNIHCFRLLHSWPYSMLRRFFIGDYQNYDDITGVGLTEDVENTVLNKLAMRTVGTGELKVSVSVVQQSSALQLADFDATKSWKKGRLVLEQLQDSGLARSVEQVVMAFKKAKLNLIEVRRTVHFDGNK